MNANTVFATLAILSLSACASTPPEEPVQVAAERTPPPPQPVAPQPEARVAETTLAPAVEYLPQPGTAEDFIYQSGGDARIYFGYDQYDLSPAARETLRRQAQWLSTYPRVMAVVEGNADERGTREYNLALGARRADSVKEFLVAQGIAPNRLTTVSYGKERPIDGRSNEDAWARNRNGHTNILLGTIG